MNSGQLGIAAGCVLNLLIIIIVGVLISLFSEPMLVAIWAVTIPVGFAYGRKVLAAFSGPKTALWLYTGNIGISFALLSIDLFRQDKKFSKSELEKLCGYFAKEFGQEVYKVTKAFVARNMHKKINLMQLTVIVKGLGNRDRLLFFYHLFSMALADGKYSPEEDAYLIKIAKLINISDYHFDVIKKSFLKEFEHQSEKSEQSNYKQESKSKNKDFNKQFFSPYLAAYLTLGLNKFATNDEIKDAFRKLAKKYHPDKYHQSSETEIKEAEQKFREIREAYELIRKERGMK